MKRIWAGFLAMLLMLGGFALAEEDWYMETAKELAACVGELAGDKGYLELMTSSPNLLEMIEPLSAVDFSQATGGYRLTLPVDWMALIFQMSDSAPESKAGKELVRKMLQNTIVTQYVGMQGAERLAAATMLTYSRTERMPEGFKAQTVLLGYEGAVVAVSFSQTGDETITVSAQPIFAEEILSMEDLVGEMTALNPSVISEKLF